MKVLLIDADSTIPNLVLMKLAGFYRSRGYKITLIKANLPYYPNKKKKEFTVDTSEFDLSFCSVIFKGNSKFITGENIQFGGTGFDMMIKLPKEIEEFEPDYSIYHGNKASYGFISRGCNRTCYFCDVHIKEGKTRIVVSDLKKIIKHLIFYALDNNFLQLKNHCEILRIFIEEHPNVKVQFNQGLDIRLITKENSELLRTLNYIGDYIFAFDDLRYKSVIKKKLDLMAWRKPFKFKFYIYIHPDMPIFETLERIRLLTEWGCLPYIMRDLSCWGSPNEKFYTDLAAWCNQPSIFKKMSFKEFLSKRHTGKNELKRMNRINTSLNIYNKNKE